MSGGPTITQYGDVISSNLSASIGYGDAATARYSAFNVMPGQIQQVYAVDDPNNLPGSAGGGVQTLYDVLVYHPDGTTELARRCIMLQPGFGGTFNNFAEVLPTNPGPQAQNGKKNTTQKPGSQVLVAFMNGHKQSGVILGALPHPNKVALAQRPKTADGTTYKSEFQGFQFVIRNDGSYQMVFNGPRSDSGKFIGTDGPTALEFDAKGNLKFTNNADQSITIDREKKVIDVINGTTAIKMEQEGSKITTTSDFLVANVNQDATVTTGGKSVVNAKSDVTISSDSMINLQRGAGGSASEPFVMGEKFKSFMEDFLDAVGDITHLGNLGAPTPPPINKAKFAALKAKLKTLLSELIMGMK